MKINGIFLSGKKDLGKVRHSRLLRKYFNKRIETIHEILILPPADLTHDVVHQLRIEIKKMRALYGLLKKCSKGFPYKKFIRPLNELFDTAGEWRALQVQEILLKEYKAYTLTHKFTGRLKGLHHLAQKKFEKLVQSGIFEKVNRHKKEVGIFIRRIKTRELIRHLQKAESKLQQLITANFYCEHKFHPIRKSLKLHYFDVRSLDLEDPATEPWVGLMDLLGTWHDLEIAHDYLIESIYCSEHKPAEAKRLRKVKGVLLAGKEKMVEKIIEAYLRIKTPDKTVRKNGTR